MKKRLVGLDVFRVIAAIIIFLFHSNGMMDCDYGIFNQLISMSAIFMTAFFILSGYTLFFSNNYINLTDIKEIQDFYVKRIISIFPLFGIVTFVYHMRWGSGLTIVKKILLFIVDFLGLRTSFQYLPNTNFIWFVSCILFCYAVYPYCQEIIKQLTHKGKVICIVVCYVVLILAPYVQLEFQTNSYVYYSPFYRILEFIIGIALGSLRQGGVQKEFLLTWRCFVLECFGLGATVLVGIKLSWQVGNWMIYSLIGIPFFLLMLITLSGVQSVRLEKSRVFSYMCSVTYAFYLAQAWVCNIYKEMIVRGMNIEKNSMRIVFSWSLCFCITICLHELIEKPITKILKEKWILRKNRINCEVQSNIYKKN